ncbi:class I SAM-dependent methyltransferase [Peribacillus kribbensis]|uniref:class I SAM-dependent methyltransferase n=1 Tax=Peribacillus kribbensis TaxID=356658 RepID=UPI000423C5C0|nr:SAM-dependent methyltransferase [Peribacillus kribbensis]
MYTVIRDILLTRKENQLSYNEFIELALYHPQFGYYMNDSSKIGKSGDFYTSVNVSDILGTMLGKWFCTLFRSTGLRPVICELGGGTGKLAQDLLGSMKKWDPILYEETRYMIVETSPYHRILQKEALKGHTVTLVQDVEELAPFEGILFSNEFFDAFPVHVIEKRDGKLFEVMVCHDEGGKSFKEKPEALTNLRIRAYLAEEGIELSEGQRLEVPLAMMDYLQKIGHILEKGMLLTLDYGYTRSEWCLPQHHSGSLRGFRRHEMKENILQFPGGMDITTHIHFDSLQNALARQGFIHRAFLRQDELLLKLGILEELAAHTDSNPFSAVSKRNRGIRDLLMQGGISSYFRGSVETKGLEESIPVLPSF